MSSPPPARHRTRTARRLVLEALEERRLLSRGELGIRPVLDTILIEAARGDLAAQSTPVGRGPVHLAGDHASTAASAGRGRMVTFPANALGPPDETGRVTITGKVRPKAKVKIDVGGDGSIEAIAKADKRGNFTSPILVSFGSTQVTLTSSNGKKTAVATLTVNRPSLQPTLPPMPTPTPMPTPPSDLPVIPGLPGPNLDGSYGPFATIGRALEVVYMFQNMGYPNTIQYHNGDGQYVFPRTWLPPNAR